MAHFFTEDDVLALLTMPEAVKAVERAFRLLGEGKADNHPRQRVRAGKLMLHVLPAGSADLGFVGLKAYTTGPSGARFYFLMFEAPSGELAALMEADSLGQIRTGAASGVATRLMTSDDAKRVGIYGTGWQARSQLEAVAEVRKLELVRAYGRDADRRALFCRDMASKLGIPVEPCAAAEEVPDEVDIVITATNAKEPVLKGEWLRAGQHVNATGSNNLKRREIDELAVTRASFIATDSLDQAKIECGDLSAVVEAGKLSWDDVHELADVVTGQVPARQSADDITLFESQGLAIEDVAVAKIVLEKGVRSGRGRKLQI